MGSQELSLTKNGAITFTNGNYFGSLLSTTGWYVESTLTGDNSIMGLS